MNRVAFLCVFLLLPAIPLHSQSEAEMRKVFSNIADRYDNTAGYRVDMDYTYRGDGNLPLVFKGSYSLLKELSCYTYQNSVYIKEGKRTLLVHHDQQVMIYSERSTAVNNNMNHDSLLSMLFSSQVIKANLPAREIILENLQQGIEKITITYNEDFSIRRIIIGSAKQADAREELSIEYKKQEFGLKKAPDGIDKFLESRKGKVVLKEKYKGYELYTSYF